MVSVKYQIFQLYLKYFTIGRAYMVAEKIEKTYKYGDTSSPVAVATLASDYRKFDLKGYAIIGTVFTENFGIQLAIAHMLENPNIGYLILCGRESEHLAGHAFLTLHENGISRWGTFRRIIGCKSPLPFIDDIPELAIDAYQEHITLVDIIGVEDVAAIQAKIDECVAQARPPKREPMVFPMPEIDEWAWKKYAPIQEAEMKRKLQMSRR
jgi:tetrahydromethanopterin S-methyltransferase subunit A